MSCNSSAQEGTGAAALEVGETIRSSRWTNAPACDDKVIIVRHPPGCLDNLALIVSDDFYPL